jgi:hypothetical protein
MIRALKAAAAVVVLGALGGGCGASSNGTLSFAWRFSDNKGVLAGNFTATDNGCSTAYVDSVRIALDGVDQATTACAVPSNAPNGTPALDIVGVPARSHTYTVSAYRGTELVFQASGQVMSSGATTPVDVTLSPASTGSSLPIFYTQAGTYSCGGTPSVTYQVLDAYDSVRDNGTIACSATSPIISYSGGTTAYPFGPYKLHYLSLLDGGGVAVYQTCCQAIDHEGFAQVIDLPVAAGACDPNPLHCP